MLSTKSNTGINDGYKIKMIPSYIKKMGGTLSEKLSSMHFVYGDFCLTASFLKSEIQRYIKHSDEPPIEIEIEIDKFGDGFFVVLNGDEKYPLHYFVYALQLTKGHIQMSILKHCGIIKYIAHLGGDASFVRMLNSEAEQEVAGQNSNNSAMLP